MGERMVQLEHTLRGRTGPRPDGSERSVIEVAGLATIFELQAAFSKALIVWKCDTHKSFLDCSATHARSWVEEVCRRDCKWARPPPYSFERIHTMSPDFVCACASSTMEKGLKILCMAGLDQPLGATHGDRTRLSALVYRLLRSLADIQDAATLALFALAEVMLTRTQRRPLSTKDLDCMRGTAIPLLH